MAHGEDAVDAKRSGRRHVGPRRARLVQCTLVVHRLHFELDLAVARDAQLPELIHVREEHCAVAQRLTVNRGLIVPRSN
eukprot:7034324-Prymnesium_polylepis.1